MYRDYEERYGEHVGFCRIHKQRVLGSCDDCEDDARENYDHEPGDLEAEETKSPRS
jgi:hypothetical protein